MYYINYLSMNLLLYTFVEQGEALVNKHRLNISYLPLYYLFVYLFIYLFFISIHIY